MKHLLNDLTDRRLIWAELLAILYSLKYTDDKTVSEAVMNTTYMEYDMLMDRLITQLDDDETPDEVRAFTISVMLYQHFVTTRNWWELGAHPSELGLQ